jgi:L-threonylcarbamoyladenylate synthase
VAKILHLKGRSEHKGLILIGCHWDQFKPYLRGLDREQYSKLQTVYHKPITWLVPHNGVAPPWIIGKHNTLALRVTHHPVAAALCQVFGEPLVSTSANPQGLPAATCRFKVKCYFSTALDYCTPGHVGTAKKSSQIRNLMTNEVVRQG